MSLMKPISVFKPNGWHLADSLDGRIYRAGAAIDGVIDILQVHLADEIPSDVQKALFSCGDLLCRIRDEMFSISNVLVACEDEAV